MTLIEFMSFKDNEGIPGSMLIYNASVLEYLTDGEYHELNKLNKWIDRRMRRKEREKNED